MGQAFEVWPGKWGQRVCCPPHNPPGPSRVKHRAGPTLKDHSTGGDTAGLRTAQHTCAPKPPNPGGRPGHPRQLHLTLGGLVGGGAWAPWQPRERGGLVSLGSAGVGSEEVASQEVTLPLY